MNGDANGKAVKRSGSSKGRMQVALLDDTVVTFDVEPRCKAEELYKKVNTHLNLDEPEFFGLLYIDENDNQAWLDHLKPISKQVREANKTTFKFRVMFYTPDPNSLQEYTRYLFTLQVRRDLLDGRLHCSQDTGSLLASYIVQGELGDYDPLNHQEGYLAGFQFVPNQTVEIEEKIVNYHKSHRGESPAKSDHNMLEIARQLEMYGITLYAAQDGDVVKLSLTVYHSGILVFRDKHKINTFSWANIRKLSFKKKRFLIKLHQAVGEDSVVSFNMTSRNGAKAFWKICINHHVFFRHSTAPSLKKKNSIKKGSKYRYSGRTKKEITDEANTKYEKAPTEAKDNSEKSHQRVSMSFLKDNSHYSHTPKMSPSPQPFESRNMSRQISEDEGSFSLASEPYSPRTNHRDEVNHRNEVNHQHEDFGYEDSLATTPLITRANDRTDSADCTTVNQHNIITIKHQDTIESMEFDNTALHLEQQRPPSYNDIVYGQTSSPTHHYQQVNDTNIRTDDYNYANIQSSPYSFNYDVTDNPINNTNGVQHSDMAEGDDISLDATIHVTSTDRELEDEVTSVFQKITSEYGSKSPTWQYNISSATNEDVHSDDDEKQKHAFECAEADANVNTLMCAKPEVDEDTDEQLKERVKEYSYFDAHIE